MMDRTPNRRQLLTLAGASAAGVATHSLRPANAAPGQTAVPVSAADHTIRIGTGLIESAPDKILIHPMHLHRHTFELTRMAGSPTAGVGKGVVMVGGFQEADIGFFMADQPGLSLFHCHSSSTWTSALWPSAGASNVA